MVEGDGWEVVGAGVVGAARGSAPGRHGQRRLLHVLLELLHVPLELGPPVLEPADHLQQERNILKQGYIGRIRSISLKQAAKSDSLFNKFCSSLTSSLIQHSSLINLITPSLPPSPRHFRLFKPSKRWGYTVIFQGVDAEYL